jgi:hypothetical protein
MTSRTYAVLLADVLGSSSRPGIRRLLGQRLAQASQRHQRQKWIRLPYSVTAGDEFQTLTDRLESVPAIILDLRRTLQPLPLRIGVGFGRVSERIQAPVNRLGGEAFQYARQAIEGIKTSRRFRFLVLTSFQTSAGEFDTTVNLIYGLQDTLVRKITAKQWATIDAFMDQPGLEQVAKRLRVNISTVSRNLKRGYYWQLSETAAVVKTLIERTF